MVNKIKMKEKNKMEKTCLRCGNVWIALKENPKCCTRCKSPAWNKPRIRESKSTWR